MNDSPWQMSASNLKRRRAISAAFKYACLGMTLFAILMVIVLIWRVADQGAGRLSWDFITNFPSRFPDKAGIYPALMGTIWLVVTTALISVPLGVASAIYLEEYSKKGRISSFIEVNITNLAGVPSIVYGILGLAVFCRWLQLGFSILAGALTLSLLILPVVITASREAIRAVPQSMRQAAFAVGATRWQTIWHHVLPASLPGIMTGVILSLSRAIGETAPLIVVGAALNVTMAPDGVMSSYSVLPLNIYAWVKKPIEGFDVAAAAAIIVLLAVLLVLNGIAVFIRSRYSKKLA